VHIKPSKSFLENKGHRSRIGGRCGNTNRQGLAVDVLVESGSGDGSAPISLGETRDSESAGVFSTKGSRRQVHNHLQALI